MAERTTKPAKGRALKVFRTTAGFHDAYVAAPSRKAALAAWGTDKDLFARGAAERVEDPELTAEPLAHPGTVIRRTRGSLEEQLAAAGPPPPRSSDKAAKSAKPGRPPVPRPSRETLAAAEAALEEAEDAAKRENEALRREEEALRQRRERMERDREAEHARLEKAVVTARKDYNAALDRWRAAG